MKLKTAVIGLGRMGAEPSARLEGIVPNGWLPITHIEAIQTTEGLKLVALCDKDEAKRNRFSALYNVENVYEDYKQMIDEVKPDIISVATRTDIRDEVILYAIENGVKGIYTEKPITQNITKCRKIVEALKVHDVKIVYGATRRAMAVYQKAKEISLSGELGNLVQINADFGKALLLWSLPHVTDLFVYFSDSVEIKSIQGWCDLKNTTVSRNILDVDPVVESAFFKFKNGVSATISQTGGLNIRLSCLKGNVTVHGDGSIVEVCKEGKIAKYYQEREVVSVNSERSGTQNLFADIRDAVINKSEVKMIHPNEILAGHQMLFGLVESTLAGGKMIYPNDINEDLIITGRTGELIA